MAKVNAKKPNTKTTTKLSEKEIKFCNEYIKSGNGTEAVKKAGYKVKDDKSAGVISTRLLKKISVAEKITALREKAESKAIADATEVMEYLTKVMRGEIKDQFGLDAPLNERTKAAQELAKRTIDIDNRIAGKPDATLQIKLDWQR